MLTLLRFKSILIKFCLNYPKFSQPWRDLIVSPHALVLEPGLLLPAPGPTVLTLLINTPNGKSPDLFETSEKSMGLWFCDALYSTQTLPCPPFPHEYVLHSGRGGGGECSLLRFPGAKENWCLLAPEITGLEDLRTHPHIFLNVQINDLIWFFHENPLQYNRQVTYCYALLI